MKKYFLCIIISFIFFSCNSLRNSEWNQSTEFLLEDKIYKQDGNITYFFNIDTSLADRKNKINYCKTAIRDNLNLIEELDCKDSIRIIFVHDRQEMYKYTYRYVNGTAFFADDEGINMIFCIYNKLTPIKHELMHMIARLKWGPKVGGDALAWLDEGLATYADPVSQCDDYSFEEKYIAFMQNDKLIGIDPLLEDFHGDIFNEEYNFFSQNKIRYNQSAYIVGYLIENYGIDKVKLLWQNGMEDFEKIYGITFEQMMSDINSVLAKKHPDPIDFDWNRFEEKCY